MPPRVTRTIHVGDDDLLAVASSPTGEFIAVGRRGRVLRRRGGTWVEEAAPLAEDLYGVAMRGGRVLAVGGNLDIGGQSKVCEYLDGAWRVWPSGVQSLLLDVDCRDDDAWACGFNGDLVRWVDDSWRQVVEIDRFEHFFSLGILSDGGLVIGTLGGHVLERSEGGVWSTFRVSDGHLHGVATSTDDACAVGAGGVVALRSKAWGCHQIDRSVTLHAVASHDDGFVVAGTEGLVADARGAWRKRTSDSILYGVAASGPLIVAVGARGAIVELDAGE